MSKKQQPKHRRCTKCREIKPVEEFYLYWHSMQNTQYFTAHCKVCTRMERRQAYHQKKRQAIIDKEPIDRGQIHRAARERTLPQEKKYCTRCNHDKNLNEFYQYYDSRKKTYRHRSECKECTKSKQRQPKHNTNLSPRVQAWMISLIARTEEELWT